MSGLTNEQAAIREMTRDFVRKDIAPFAAEWDRTATVPLDAVRKAGALGLFGMGVPAEWGGSGADFVSYILMTEELAYGDVGVCNMISATNAFAWKVRDHGTAAQKARFLRPVTAGEALACLMYTEPQAGSDAANQQTRAVRRGDRWIINGTKSFITSGRSAAVGVLLAVTDPAAGKRGISAFLLARSCSRISRSRRRTCSARRGRGSRSRSPISTPAGSAWPRSRSASPAPRSTPLCGTRASGRRSARS
jgi:butyryl-CoA dehydrogenase